MNEQPGNHVEGSAETHIEGNPEVERLEQQVLGKHYEQTEVLHKFAVDHPWVHPTLIVGVIAVIAGLAWFVWRARKAKTSHQVL